MSLNYIGMIQYIGHGTKKQCSHGLLLFPFLKSVITPKMDLLTFWKTFWKTFPSAKVVVPIPQNPQKWMMWGKGKLMNSGRREWKVNIAGEIACRNLPHTQSIAERGSFGNILCVMCGKHATWTRTCYLVEFCCIHLDSFEYFLIVTFYLEWFHHSSHTQHIILPFQVIGCVAF